MKKINNRGETIIEVLLSIVVLGFTISIIFVIARNSLYTAQASSERTQALTIVESQIERLKYLATLEDSETPAGIFGQSEEFCIDTDNEIVPVNAILPTTDCDTDLFPDPTFTIRISYDADGPDGVPSTPVNLSFDDNTFTITAQWTRVGSSDQEQISFVYRLHPETPVPQLLAGSLSLPGLIGIPSSPSIPDNCTDEFTLDLTAYILGNVDEDLRIHVVDLVYFADRPVPGRGESYGFGRPFGPYSNPDVILPFEGITLDPDCDYTANWEVYCTAGQSIGEFPSDSDCGRPRDDLDSPAEIVYVDLYESYTGDRNNSAQCTDSTGGFQPVARFRTTDETRGNRDARWSGLSPVDLNISSPVNVRCVEFVHVCIDEPQLCQEFADYVNSLPRSPIRYQPGGNSIVMHQIGWEGVQR